LLIALTILSILLPVSVLLKFTSTKLYIISAKTKKSATHLYSYSIIIPFKVLIRY